MNNLDHLKYITTFVLKHNHRAFLDGDVFIGIMMTLVSPDWYSKEFPGTDTINSAVFFEEWLENIWKQKVVL